MVFLKSFESRLPFPLALSNTQTIGLKVAG